MKPDIYNVDCKNGFKELESETIDLIVTDPPYEVNYGERSKELSALDNKREKQIARDKGYHTMKIEYPYFCKEFYRVLKENAHIYIWSGEKQIEHWCREMREAGFKFSGILFWLKERQTLDISFGYNYNSKIEECLFFRKGKKKLNMLGLSNVFTERMRDEYFHPTQKPLNITKKFIRNSSVENDLVLDPFLGSGTTAIACKQLNRKCIGFEISDYFYDISIERLRNTQYHKWF